MPKINSILEESDEIFHVKGLSTISLAHLKEILSFSWLHVNLTLVNVVDIGEVGKWVSHSPWGSRTAPHHWLLQLLSLEIIISTNFSFYCYRASAKEERKWNQFENWIESVWLTWFVIPGIQTGFRELFPSLVSFTVSQIRFFAFMLPLGRQESHLIKSLLSTHTKSHVDWGSKSKLTMGKDPPLCESSAMCSGSKAHLSSSTCFFCFLLASLCNGNTKMHYSYCELMLYFWILGLDSTLKI